MKQYLLAILGLVCSVVSFGQTISTNISTTSFCQGDQAQVFYFLSGGSFNSGNTFYLQLSDENGDFTSPDTIGTNTSIYGGTIQATFPAPIQPGSGYRMRVVGSNPSVIGSDNGQNLTINGTTLQDTTFGNNAWNVFAYEGNFTNYKGYYVDNNLEILTSNFFSVYGSPSDATGYEGCTVSVNNHDFVYKRRGFPCGYYTLDVRGDDAHRIYLDGSLIYSSGYTPSIQNAVWTGFLTSTSELEIQVEEDGGASVLEVHFNNSSALNVSSDLIACAGETIRIGASGGINYDWSTNTTNVVSATNNDSISIAVPAVSAPGTSETYVVLANDPTNSCLFKDSVEVTVGTNANVSLSATSWSICNGNTFNVTASGVSQFQWFPDSSITYNNSQKSSVTITATENATYRVTGNVSCATDTVDFVISGKPTGDPVVYGNEEWIAYGYNGNNFNTYRGFYTSSSTSIASKNDWNDAASPDEAATWQGCSMTDNYHSYIYKREGFECGYYQMDIPYHDDDIQVIVDGQTVYQLNTWYNYTARTNVWSGYLGENSQISVSIKEGYGRSSLGVTLTPLRGPAANSNHTVWNGDVNTTWSNAGNWCGGVPTVSDTVFLLDRSNDPVMVSDLSMAGLFVDESLSLTVGTNTLTVSDRIENNGSISVSNAGSIIQTGTGNNNRGDGTYAIERVSSVVEDNTRYNFWSMPMSDETMEDVFPACNPVDFYTFTTGSYVSASGTVTAGVGFTSTGDINASYPRSFTRTFSGSDLNNGNITVTGLANGSILLGNPYPSGLDLDAFAASNSNLSNDYYFWDHNTYQDTQGDNQSADWAQYNVAMGSGTAAGSGAQIPSGYIASAQGFFATKNSGTSVTYRNSHRSANNTQFFKTNSSNKNLAWFNLTNDSNDFNQILVGVLPTASDELDGSDGEKQSVNLAVSFYSVVDNKKLGIQGVATPEYQESKWIELGVVANVTGSYSIALDSTFNWPSDYDLYLIDLLLKEETNMLTTPSYSFEVQQADTISKRFYLNIVNKEEKPTSVKDVASSTSDIRIYQSNHVVWIDALESEQQVQQIDLVSVTGKVIYTGKMQGNIHNIDLSRYANGVYVVRVKTNDGTQTQKVIR